MDASAEFFKLIDSHAREQHQCFLAELFIGSDPTAYTLCFRPSGPDRESPNRYACRYLNLAIVDVEKMVSAGSLDDATVALLKRELLTLQGLK
jgi:hypothetical protein